MSEVSYILKKIPYYGKDVTVVPDDKQDTGKIVDYIQICHDRQKGDYDKFADQFWKGSVRDTARHLFNFMKQNVRYKIEPESFQSVQTPASILYRGFGDCKHYSLFINGVVDALHRAGYPIRAKYRLVSDSPDREVHHVFAVVSDPEKNILGSGEYWTDPVLGGFNARPTFYNQKDIAMSIHYLSGTTKYAVQQVGYYGDAEMGNVFKKFAHAMEVNFKNVKKGVSVNAQVLAKDISHAAHQVSHAISVDAKNAGKIVKSVTSAVVKVAELPVRKAFLSLVALNVHNFAKDLDAARNNPQQAAKLRNKWEHGLNGDWKTLDIAINNGRNRHRIGHIIGVVGIDDAAVATWLTLAAAAIGTLGEFLHSAKNNPGQKQELAKQAQQGAANILANAYNASTGGEAAADALNKLVQPNKGSGAMAITPGVNDAGEPEVTVHDIDSPAVRALAAPNKGDGTPDEAYYAGQQESKEVAGKNARRPGGPSAIDKFLAEVERIWTEHKTPILVVAGVGTGVALLARKRKGRR